MNIMYKKTLLKTLYLMFLAGWLSLTPSCIDSVLDKQPLDRISEEAVWNDPNLVDAYIAGRYDDITIFHFDSPNVGGDWGFVFAILSSTTVSDESGSPTFWGDINTIGYKMNGIDINGGLLEWWEEAYTQFRRLNMLIEALPNSSNDPDFIATRVAEARFLRAFHYFALVKRYGGVPLITKVVNLDSPEEELYPVRSSEQEIYDFILSELDDIEETLKGLTEYGRASQGAALALKCRAALYAGSIARYGKVQLNGLLGIPQDRAASYYQKSMDAAQKLATCGYSLYSEDADKVTNFKNLFLKKRNSEMIFVERHNEQNNHWFYDYVLCPYPHEMGAGAAVPVYLEMVEEFELRDGSSGKFDREAIQTGLWTMEELLGDRDPRFFASIWTNGTLWKGAPIDMHRGLIGSDGVLYEGGEAFGGINANGAQPPNGTGFGVLKMLDETSNAGITRRTGTDCPIFRYGEVLLNLAESAYELGRTDVALDALNQIRTRAGIAPKTAIDLETIQHERKVELFFENHRYWDLRRWRIAEDKLSKPSSGVQYRLDYDTRKYQIVVVENYDGATPPRYIERNYYFPVTRTRTTQNKNLIENPGYE
jgi:hypothetical protein